MKKSSKVLASLALSALIGSSVTLSACSFLSCESDITGQHFTISYTDYDGKHTEDARHGFTFVMKAPQRTGYKFLGFYDAETDGNQIADEYGCSLDKYTYRENITLYPRWKANEYTVVLNYGGGSGSVKAVKAEYDKAIPELPKTVEYEHHNFKGWYTLADCGGVQIADTSGLNPIVSVVNADNFDIESENITLYAGYDLKNYEVTLSFNNGRPDEKVSVPYGTDVKDIPYKTRSDDRKAVLTWTDVSTEIYTGKVTGNMTLYAAEWANCINFDVDGGEALAPVVARDGAEITLPAPVKALNKFVQWEKDGVKYNASVMPSESVTLKAKWQAQIEFDSNGGSVVDPVSAATGASITLPKPAREGYFFAGWYTGDKQEYAAAEMPENGVALKAGWYKAKTQKTTLNIGNDSASGNNEGSFKYSVYAEANPSKIMPKDVGDQCVIKWHFKARHTNKDYTSQYFKVAFYSQKTASNAYLISSATVDKITSTWRDCVVTTAFKPTDTVYMLVTPQYSDGNWSVSMYYISDLYVECQYADASKLYL